MRRFFFWLGAGIAATLGVAILALLVRIALYHQRDDPRRLEAKRRYLETVAAGPGAGGPSLVVILFDDLGYGDLGAYGSRSVATPAMDRLAAGGARFTVAYAASPYCSASRAGLLTGRYAVRAGLDHVVQAPWTWRDMLLRIGWRNRRLPAEEITLAEILAAAGYATALFGKWHLGDAPPSLPGDLGFQRFWGLLHSNDQGRPAVWDGRGVAERHPIDQETLTRRYTERAVAFIEEHRGRPFFLYLPHTFPHVPLHAAADRRGRSRGGLYGDVVEELDWSVGRIAGTLDRLGLAGSTLVVVSSDNGPWFQGSPGGVRGRKFSMFEGGMRVPLIASWPDRIPPGLVIDEPVISVDLLPTMLELTGLPPPPDRLLDGESLAARLEGREPAAPHGPIYFHQLGELRAVRLGRFKYHGRHRVEYGNPMDWSWGPFRLRGPWLFDLALDPDESYDVAARHPTVARHLRELFTAWSRELAANPRGWR